MDDSILMIVLKNAWVLFLAVFGWIGRGMRDDIDKTRDALSDHKLHVADNYIKKDVVERIHDRIDSLAEKSTVEKMGNEVREVRDGINKILTMMAQNGRIKTID